MADALGSIKLGAAVTSPQEARRFVAAHLESLGLHGLVDPVALVADELITNAILHANSPANLTLYLREGNLRLEVHDNSSVMPKPRRPSDHATSGRGLALVEGLSAAWGASPCDDGGKVVWADFTPVRLQPPV